MKKRVYIVVSIDTECDKDPNWEIPQPMQFKNLTIQKAVLGPLYDKYKIKPTYLLSPEILKYEECVNIFKEFESIELGTHLHEEFVAPDENMLSKRTKNIQGDLSLEVEQAKMRNLTELFKERFGFSPKSFRAGRFGYSPHTFDILNDLGYTVDSSVTPFKTNYFPSGYKTNGWGKPLEPFFCGSNKRILQVPVTIINRDFLNIPKFLLSKMESKNISITKKVFNKLGYRSQPEWLRPYRNDGEELTKIAEFVIHNHFQNENFGILNIMFHSNEILKNASPYCKNDNEVLDFMHSLDFLCDNLTKRYNVCFIGLGDVYKLYSQN